MEKLLEINKKDVKNKIVIFLDFDGVINSISSFSSNDNKKTIYQKNPTFDEEIKKWGNIASNFIPEFYPITYSPSIVNEINKISQLKNVKIVWLTTWRENVAAPLKKIGIDTTDHSFLPWDNNGGSFVFSPHIWGKAVELKNFIDETKMFKIVWVDDEAAARIIKYKFIDEEFFQKDKMLSISPFESGIDDKDITLIKNFINGGIGGSYIR